MVLFSPFFLGLRRCGTWVYSECDAFLHSSFFFWALPKEARFQRYGTLSHSSTLQTTLPTHAALSCLLFRFRCRSRPRSLRVC